MACEGWGNGDHCKVTAAVGEKAYQLDGIVKRIDKSKHQILVEFAGVDRTLARASVLLEDKSTENCYWIDAHSVKK